MGEASVLGDIPTGIPVPHLPVFELALLAGILVKVGTDIIDWDYLKRLKSAPKAGVLMMFTVLFITVFVDLITAVAIGMIMASFVFMQRMVDLQLESITAITEPHEESPLTVEESQILTDAKGRILLYHISGPMSFGAAKGMARRLASFDEYDVLVLDLSDVSQIDFTSTRALDDMLHDAWDSGREAYLVGCKKPVCDMIKKQGVVDKFHQDRLKMTRIEALKDGLRLVREQQAAR